MPFVLIIVYHAADLYTMIVLVDKKAFDKHCGVPRCGAEVQHLHSKHQFVHFVLEAHAVVGILPVQIAHLLAVQLQLA